ncbi:MAG: oligosaccharide flippase family protein [Anaerolineales bacterium]|nr:oligosaccharide flippase family protein [Anaerolineales bacterium]
MNLLVRFTAISSVSFLVNMGMLMLRAKVLAVLLEPEGVGLLSQINTLDGMLSTFASIGIGYGITNLIARAAAAGEPCETANIYRTGFLLSLILGSLCTGLLVLLAHPLSTLLLGTSQLAIFFYMIAAAYPLKFLTGLFSSTLNGYKEINALAWVKGIVAVLGVIFMVGLAWFYGVTGAVLGITAWAVVALIVNRVFLYRSQGIRGDLANRGAFRADLAGEIIRFGSVNLIVLVLNYLAVLTLRSQVIHVLGSGQNGIYQVVWAMSSQYLLLIPQSLWVYSFPRISETLKTPEVVRLEMGRILRLGLLLFIPAVFLILANRELIILMLYTEQFLPAADLFKVQVWGDLFHFILWWVMLPLFARRKFVLIFFLELLRSLGYIVLGLWLLPVSGLAGISVGYTMINVVAVVAAAILVHRVSDYREIRKNLKFVLWAAVLYIISLVLPQNGWGLSGSLLIITGWFYVVLGAEEKEQIISFLFRKNSFPS